MKIQKFDGRIVELNDSTETYEWTSGEQEYSLVYDNEGDLLGIDIEGIEQDILDDIIDRPYSYDFPSTVDEYNKGLF
ncbi:MAG: hypothetical protein ACLS90_00370 [Clostridia bacterium]